MHSGFDLLALVQRHSTSVQRSTAQPALPCLRVYAASASQKPGRGRGFNPNVKDVLVKSHLAEGRAPLLNRHSDEGRRIQWVM